MNHPSHLQYAYVGPEEIRTGVVPTGTTICSREDLIRTLSVIETETLTFVIDLSGILRLADRHAEHVACAHGEDVLSAGEISFDDDMDQLSIEYVTNQSTGYCPEPASWAAVASALDGLGVKHSGGFSKEFQFRRCPVCRQTILVKDAYFVCDICEAELPQDWNYLAP